MKLTQDQILPEFMRTRHLPLEPHASRDDLVADLSELKYVLLSDNVVVQEKVDD